METFICLEEVTVLKDVWKFVTKVPGALSVMTHGTTLMLKLYATSWALLTQVQSSNSYK